MTAISTHQLLRQANRLVLEVHKNSHFPLVKHVSLLFCQIIHPRPSQVPSNMTSLNNTNLPYTGSILSDQISLLGVLFPGLGPVVSSVLPLLAGTPSIFGRLLCLCGFLLMIVGYVQNYLETFLRTYFSR